MSTQPRPLRAALYARYSSDNQRRTSIDDQLHLARERCEREGWVVVAEHTDEEISAATPVEHRPGSRALYAAALAGRFDVLVIEALDRLARNLGDQERVVERLEFRSIRLVGTSDGYDSAREGRELERGMRGLINSQYLRDLAKKTHRGLAGQFSRGHHVGGVCFGYRSEPAADGAGRRLVVDEAQAATVRRIFAAYAAGDSPRTIAHSLNAAGLPSPRGGTWAMSALVGDRRLGAGLLNNEMYAGRWVWNRRQWLKDPETGRRRHVERPLAEWKVRDVPELRIVEPELWLAARARDRRLSGRARGGAPMRTLFAGLLRCSRCGGPMTAIDARRYGCHVLRDRGPAVCAGGGAFPREMVDQALLAVVRDELQAPAVLAQVQAEVRTALRAAAAESATAGNAAAARRKALQAEIGRLVDAVARVGVSDALAARLRQAEAELASIGQPAPAVPDVDQAVQQALAAYRRRLLELRSALEQAANRERTRELLAELLGPVVLRRDDEGDWAEMDEPAARVALAGSTLLTVVAGARFELATFGL